MVRQDGCHANLFVAIKKIELILFWQPFWARPVELEGVRALVLAPPFTRRCRHFLIEKLC